MPIITEWDTAIWTSLTTALPLLFVFIPKLVGFLLILLVGWLVASALSKAVTFLLREFDIDRLADRIGLTRLEAQMNMRMDATGILGRIIYWFVLPDFLSPSRRCAWPD